MVTTEYSGMEQCGRTGQNISIRVERIFNCFFSACRLDCPIWFGQTIKLNISQIEAKTSSGIKALEGSENKSIRSNLSHDSSMSLCLQLSQAISGNIVCNMIVISRHMDLLPIWQ